MNTYFDFSKLDKAHSAYANRVHALRSAANNYRMAADAVIAAHNDLNAVMNEYVDIQNDMREGIREALGVVEGTARPIAPEPPHQPSVEQPRAIRIPDPERQTPTIP